MNLTDEFVQKVIKENGAKVMSKARILVVDFNTLKYDSFHMLALKLFEEEVFNEFFKKVPGYARMSIEEKIQTIFTKCTERNPYDYLGIEPVVCLNDAYEEFLASSARVRDNNFFKSDMYFGVEQSSWRNEIERIFILRHLSDEAFRTEYEQSNPKITAYATDKFFCIPTLLDFIEQYRINTVIIDSVDVATKIAEATSNKTIIYGDYAYNYIMNTDSSGVVTQTVKNVDILSRLEREKGHEFATFRPFSFTHLPKISGGIFNNKQ